MHHQVKQTKGMSSSALYAVGGVIVGTTAICHLFDNTRSGVQKQLRGLNEVQSGVATVIDGSTNHVLLPPHLSESPDEVRATSADDSASSNDEDMSILYEWAYEETTPNMSNVTWERHLAHYDQYDISANMISTSQRRRTNLFSPTPDRVRERVGERFRLKLLWRGGYLWQERASETWWCMGCGNCNVNAVMKLTNCKAKTSADALFERIRHTRGDQYRVSGSNLCLQKIGRRGTKIALKPCSKGNVWQLFKGYRSGKQAFDIRPRKVPGRCLTNHHHPKTGEVVYAEYCKKAHKTKTGYWVEY